MKKTQIIIAAALLYAAAAEAQETWNLRKCIDYATENNIQIKQQNNLVSKQEIALSTAKNQRLPDLNGNASESFNFGRVLTVDNTYANQNNQNTSLGLSTSIPLFTGFQIPNNIALNKLNLKAAVEDLKKAKEAISIQVTQAYLQVLFAEELLKVADNQVELSKTQLDRVDGFFKNGKMSESQLMEAKATLAQDEMNAVERKNSLQLAILDLTQLLELPSPQGFQVASPDITFDGEPLTSPEDIYAMAVTTKPQILSEQYRLEGSERSIKIAQGGYYPRLSLNGSLGSSYYKTNNIPADGFSRQLKDHFNKYIGISLSIPIFDRFSTRNNVRSAKVDYLNQQLQLDNTKKGLYKEIQQAYYNALAAESKYASSEVAQKATESAFQLMEQKFENGKASATEYKEVKNNLFKAESTRVQAKYDYLFRTKILDFYKGIPIDLK